MSNETLAKAHQFGCIVDYSVAFDSRNVVIIGRPDNLREAPISRHCTSSASSPEAIAVLIVR